MSTDKKFEVFQLSIVNKTSSTSVIRFTVGILLSFFLKTIRNTIYFNENVP